MRRFFTLENPWWFWISAALVGGGIVTVVYLVVR